MEWDESAEGVLATLCRMVPDTIRELAKAAAYDEADGRVLLSIQAGTSSVFVLFDPVTLVIIDSPPVVPLLSAAVVRASG